MTSRRERLYFWVFRRQPRSVVDRRLAELDRKYLYSPADMRKFFPDGH